MSGAPDAGAVVTLGLASVRIVALFSSAPIFGHAAVPVRVRAALALVVAAMLGPEVGASVPAAEHLLGGTGLVLREALIGFTLGFSVRLVFSAFDLLGEFVSVQGGLGAATVLDPTSGANSVVLASLFRLTMLVVFLGIEGHHQVLRAVFLSYERMPIGGDGPEAGAFLALLALGGSLFEIAVRLAAPVTVSMLIANFAVGILGRVIPQLNLMTVQLPAQVAAALALIMLGARPFLEAATTHLDPWTGTVLAALLGES